jgi:hypothetical protein
MSVRATDRLIGDIVKVTNLPNSPFMVVHSVNPEEKLVNVTWFADDKSVQEAEFPASALDRADAKAAPAKAAKAGKAKKK